MRGLRLIILILFVFAPAVARADPLVVFAAASLKEPLDRIAEEVGDVRIAYGGSGTLARQIARGAPADVVVLAHPVWMDWLGSQAALGGAPVDVAGNTLVLAGRDADATALTPDGLLAALGEGRLAMGQRDAVPAGIYGAEALRSLGLWTTVEDRLAEVENVRVATALLRRRAVPLAIVYGSDLVAAPDLHAKAMFPAGSHAPITYQAARIAGRSHAGIEPFLAALTGETGQAAFAAAGFQPPDPG